MAQTRTIRLNDNDNEFKSFEEIALSSDNNLMKYYLIELYERRNEMELAINLCLQMMTTTADHSYVEVIHKLGCLYSDQGNWSDAKNGSKSDKIS